jgi:threonine/homoserine/homoserine lactone efflux protein
MSDNEALVATLSILLVGAMSPGASFILIAQRSVRFSRRDGIAMAFGMGVAAIAFNITGIFGFSFVLDSLPWLKVLGGAYLLYLAMRTWKSASAQIIFSRNLDGERKSRIFQSFRIGFVAHILNPKALLFYISALSVFVEGEREFIYQILLLASVFMLEVGWYSTVEILFSNARLQSYYLAFRCWIDRISATTLGVLGVAIIVA